MISTIPEDSEIDLLLAPYDPLKLAVKREAFARLAYRSLSYSKLLEQYSHYELGGGFTINKVDSGWMIYFRGKHVDLHKSNHPERLTSYSCITVALDAFTEMSQREEWD